MVTARVVLVATALAFAGGLAGSARQQAPGFRTLSFTASGASAGAVNRVAEARLADGRLRPARFQDDTMVPGRTHERLAQFHGGLPVFGSEIVRQIDGGGVRSVFGETFEGIAVGTSPTISPGDALRLAIGDDETASAFEQAVLGVLPHDGTYALAWRVPVRSRWNVEDVYVDAASGAVLRRVSRVHSQLGDIGLGHGVFGDVKKIAARRGGSGFQLHDAVRPGIIQTFDLHGSLSRFRTFWDNGVLGESDLAQDADNTWDDGVVVDAHAHQGLTYDYFFKRFGRRGMDDANGRVTTVTHPLARSLAAVLDEEDVGQFINNAFYLQGTRLLVFGDGDGRFFNYLAAGLDVVAHEWTHGVTNYGAQLIYQDESGALDESFSDIMAAAAEFMFQNPGEGLQRADWVLGEDVLLGAPFLRSMSDPIAGFPPQPDHYSLRRFIGTPIDNGGVHINSGIPNHAFYLAVAGGRHRVSGLTVQGIGLENIERMERIFYRAFVYFLTPRARFTHARLATLAAAAELYGQDSPEFVQLQQAWAAVGVN